MTSLPCPSSFCPIQRPPKAPKRIQAAMYHPIPTNLMTPAHLLPMTKQIEIITHIKEKAQASRTPICLLIFDYFFKKSSPPTY